jgi:CDP-diacylglycerol--glycerol-3-phosphate 3-phosphatidyltransferase
MNLSSAASPALTISFIVVTLAVVLGYALWGRWRLDAQDPRLARVGRSPFLGTKVVHAFYWALGLAGSACVHLRLPADVLTWTALALSLGSVPAAATGRLGLAGALVLVGAVFDVLDGMVARTNGTSSRAGGLLDSVLDRYADVGPLVGLAVLYRFSVWQMLVPLAAIVGATMTSYVRAKAESFGLELPSGAMRRHERVVYLGLALLVGPWATPLLGAPAGVLHPLTLAIVGLVAVASNIAAIRLFIEARRALQPQPVPPRLRLRDWLAVRSDGPVPHRRPRALLSRSHTDRQRATEPPKPSDSPRHP